MSKITRRSYKRKKIIMGAGLFGAIGLVSTGFAAWVLSAPATQDKSASLSVGLVSDKNMKFENVKIHKTGAEDDPVYHFEPKADDNKGRVRYDGENAESLSLTVDGTLTQVQNLGTIDALITVEANNAGANDRYPARTAADAKVNFDAAIAKGYVVAPTAYDGDEDPTVTLLWDKNYTVTGKASYDNFVASIDGESDKTMTFSYEVAFGWGDFFHNTNPAVYFDEDATGKTIPQGEAGDTIAALQAENKPITVAAYLQDLHDLLDGIQLKLTLTANPN